MWDGRPTSYVDHAVFTIAHRTDLTLEEIEQQFPLLFNYKG